MKNIKLSHVIPPFLFILFWASLWALILIWPSCSNESDKPVDVQVSDSAQEEPVRKLAAKALADQSIITEAKDTLVITSKDTVVSNSQTIVVTTTYPVTTVVTKPFKGTTPPPPPPATGKYLSLPKGVNQVYNNRTNLIIENLSFTNLSGDILKFNNCSNITIRNCYFGKSTGEAVSIYLGNNITVDRCLFANNRTGIYAVQTTGNIKVTNNQFVNADGPMPRGQYVQFNTITGPGNEISNNKGESWLTESYPADLINIFNSQGTAASPITVRNNILRGGGPMASGGGIMAGDIGGRFTLVEGNKLVNPGQYGIGIAGGSDITIRNNQVYADYFSFNNIGFYAWAQAGVSCGGGIVFSGNRSHYVNAARILNNFWAAPNCSCNCPAPSDITLAEMNVPAHLIDFVSPSELLTIRK